jgi:drug/metabolite transporter (DMT)-like permease
MSTSEFNPTRRQTLYALFLMFISALAVAVMINSPKLAYQGGSNPATVVTIRAIIACLVLGSGILIKRGQFRLQGKPLLLGIGSGLSSAVMLYSSYTAILYIGVSLTILIVFLNPFLIALYYHFYGTTKLTLIRLLSALIAFGGLTLVLAINFTNIDKTGLALAFVGTVGSTVMVIFTTQLSTSSGVLRANFHMSFWSLMVFAVVLLVTNDLQFPVTPLGWTGCILNGVTYAFAYLTFFAAAKIIGITRVVMISFTEPIAAIFLAAYLFGEHLTLMQWGGVALVVAGLLIMETPKDFFKRRKDKIA